jgi:histidinol-phosphate aminotransferase
MKRSDWSLTLQKSNLLDLSCNVCYDQYLDFNFEQKNCAYPDAGEAYRLLSNFYNISVQNIAIGYGSSELILRIFNLYKNYSIKIIEPTWQLAELYSHFIGMSVNENSDVLYIANPNGLTGISLSKEEILDLTNKYKLVIVDEAYGDFSNNSVLSNAITMDNLIVIKTLSKTVAAPGLRFGYCISNTDIINKIQDVRPGYVISGSTVPALKKLLPQVRPHISRMLATRAYIESKYDVVPSQGNYVLFKNNLQLPVIVKCINNFFRMSLTDIDTFKKIENEHI